MPQRHTLPWALFALFLAAAIAPVPAFANCELPDRRPFEKNAKPRDGFDTEAFINSATHALGDGLMGYVVLLQGPQGRVIASATYGFARTPCEDEGRKPFNLNTQTAWGSVTKMITTAAVIDKTERSNERSLDEKMFHFVPARWRGDVHSGHREVTIRHLLSYQSGLAANPPEGVEGSDFEERLSRPPEKRVGKRSYSNASFGIFQYMGRFFRKGRWDEIEDGYVPGEIDYDSYVLAHSLGTVKTAMQDRIFKPLNIKASCNDIDHAGNNYAHFYESNSSPKGYHLDPGDYSGCTTGGIVMSATDMGKFLYALTQTDEIISRSNYENLLAVPTNDVLGWNGSRDVADGKAFHKAGGRNLKGDFIPGNRASGRAGADIMVFPNGMTALIAINSRRPQDVKGLRDILTTAYDAGLHRAPKRTSGP